MDLNLTIQKNHEMDIPNVIYGGRSKPQYCQARQKVAIIIPYRNRKHQLYILINHLHSYLQRQELDYGIYVVEQIENQTFNRGKLLNVGIIEALKTYDWNCFVFHDVDLLLEDDRALYSCSDQPKHLSAYMDKFEYKIPYDNYFGGVSILSLEQLTKINGFSNNYWGWGGEDDDLRIRVKKNNYTIERYPMNISRYTMMKHIRDPGNEENL
uniref:Beta-1,4-galactosyltransferase n=1 Tax=Panagrolaimus sp. JU765 TaxID=591449 RepID=A0AC34Q3A7_9BILA